MPTDPRFWEIYMQLYDQGVATLHPYREFVRHIASRVPDIHSMQLVELGCGTGNILQALAQRRDVRAATLTGIDGSKEALAIASRKLHDHHIAGFVHLDLNEAAWPTHILKRQHVAVCVNVLYALKNPEAFLRNVAVVLEPDGMLILSNPYLTSFDHIRSGHELWLRLIATPDERAADEALTWSRRLIVECNAILAEEARDAKLWFLAPPVLQNLVEACGFSVYECVLGDYAGGNVTIVARRRT